MNLNLVTVNNQSVTFRLDITLVSSVGRVVLKHVSSIVWSNEWIIDSNNLNILSLQSNSQD
ncbi:Uncharacterised protein [Mycobacteroides abscessus subsp. abscessus]|nr:Uncharacterised protein [Mycobacteroides abscessus subsp. abscessus]